MRRKLWVIFVALWFLCYAILALTNIAFAGQSIVMGVLALLAAIFLFLER
jgi:hypothetical protein